MRLHAHVAADGRLEALVAAPEGRLDAGLVADPGVQVCELRGHGLEGSSSNSNGSKRCLRRTRCWWHRHKAN